MLKVLITGFCRLPGPNRAGVQLRHVLRALAQEHTVDVLVVREGDQAYVERQGTARILRVPISEPDVRGQVEAFRRALRRQIEGADYDIVHFRDGWAGVPVLEMREKLGYATVFDVARSPMAEAPLLDADVAVDLARDEDACILGADSVLVPTEHACSDVMRGRPDRVHVVPPGVDVDLFDWDEPAARPAPMILCTGTIAPGRGIRVLLRAMMDVAAMTNATLVLGGAVQPAFEMTLRKAVSDLGLSGRVEIPGEIAYEEMPALIAQSTVCVAPSATELTGRPAALYPTKLLEYMACRRAVIAPRRGSVSMLIKNGSEGLLYAPGDPADLARKIVLLLEDSGTRQRLANAGYALVREQHTASATRRALRNAYAVLVQQTPLPPRARFGEHSSPVTVLSTAMSMSGSLGLSVGDRTDEFETEFDAIQSPGDITSVEVHAEAEVRDRADSGAWTVISQSLPLPGEFSATMGDDWVVAEQRRARLDTWAGMEGRDVSDEDGTPVDGAPAPVPRSVSHENRFVAGEVEVPDLPPEITGETAFTAVSVMLGSMADDYDPPAPALVSVRPVDE